MTDMLLFCSGCSAAECAQSDFTTAVAPIIQQRIERYSAGEVMFNLLALVPDRIDELTMQVPQPTNTTASVPTAR